MVSNWIFIRKKPNGLKFQNSNNDIVLGVTHERSKDSWTVKCMCVGNYRAWILLRNDGPFLNGLVEFNISLKREKGYYLSNRINIITWLSRDTWIPREDQPTLGNVMLWYMITFLWKKNYSFRLGNAGASIVSELLIASYPINVTMTKWRVKWRANSEHRDCISHNASNLKLQRFFEKWITHVSLN